MDFFRFRRINSDFLEEEITRAVARNETYFSIRADLNDPLDCHPVYEAGISLKEYREKLLPIMAAMLLPSLEKRLPLTDSERSAVKMTSKILKKQSVTRAKRQYEAALTHGFDGIMSQTSISCFSGDWRNLAMWAHYADQGRGYALCFSQTSTEMAAKISHLKGQPDLIPEQVEYTCEREVLTLRDVLGISIQGACFDYTQLPKRLEKFARSCVEEVKIPGSRKTEHWSYEHEYRCRQFGAGAGYFRVGGIKFSKLIFGFACSNDDKQRIENILKRVSNNPVVEELTINEKTNEVSLRRRLE